MVSDGHIIGVANDRPAGRRLCAIAAGDGDVGGVL